MTVWHTPDFGHSIPCGIETIETRRRDTLAGLLYRLKMASVIEQSLQLWKKILISATLPSTSEYNLQKKSSVLTIPDEGIVPKIWMKSCCIFSVDIPFC